MSDDRQGAQKHKVALDALEVVAQLAEVLNASDSEEPRGVAVDSFVATCEAWDVLNDAELPRDVRQGVKRALRAFLGSRASDAKRRAKKREQSVERARSILAKLASTAICAAVGVVLALKGEAPWACALILVVLHVWGVKEPFERVLKAFKKRD